MPLYRPSELHSFLHSLQARAKKRLSQNFLIDGNIIAKIVEAAQVQSDDLILEIGPGPGALTEALVEKKCHIYGVEKDAVFAEALKRFPTVKVFSGDIRDFSLETLKGKKRAKVVANLPYSLTTPILNLLLPRYDLFSSVTVMVQEELARRIVALPKTKDYSSLTVFTHFYSKPIYNFFVSRNCFYPAPKVDSAVVTFHMHPAPRKDENGFIEFVRTLFGKRRKMVRTTLSQDYPKKKIEEVLQACHISPCVRPEELSLEDFLTLFTLTR